VDANSFGCLEGDFESDAVGVVEVDRFGQDVVGRSDRIAVRDQAGEDACELRFVREMDGEVVEAAVPAANPRRRDRVQDDEHLPAGAESHGLVVFVDHLESDEVAPEGNRTLTVGDVEVDLTKGDEVAVGRFRPLGQTIRLPPRSR
jgi:hypothetical protein